MTRKLLMSGLLTLALLVFAACGSTPAASGDPTAAPSGAIAPKPADSKPVEASRPTEVTETDSGEASDPTAEPAEASGDTRDIQDIGGSLDALKSYRLRFTFSFDGKDEQGKPQKGSMEFLQEIIKASKDQHLRFSSTGDAGQAGGKNGIFEFFQVGGTNYMYSPDGEAKQKCVGMTSDQGSQDNSALFKPSDVVGGLNDAKLVGKGESVNGITTDHYSFDQNAISFGTFASANGDVWIAQDGGYLVKYVGTATGKNSVLGGQSGEGTFTWEYNVEDANAVEAIALPDDCAGQQPAADIPVPDGATDKASFGKLITFKSADAPADVAAFYKKEMPAQGWAAGEANAMGDLEMLSFTKDSRKLSITITKEEQGGSSVMINEEQGT